MSKFYKFYYSITFSTAIMLLLMLLSLPFTAQAGGSSASVYYQQAIKGTITDKQGLPLPGADIRVKGTQTITSSDIEGNFTIMASPGDVLQISFVGFSPQEIAIEDNTVINVILEEDSKTLDEVVVIGYGKQKAGDVTSAVASVKSDKFTQGQVRDAGQLIQGKVAGLAVTNPTGDPTATTSIKLRGNNTLSGAYTDPLVLIDGVPGWLNTVAPEDIERIDVLKDGSAAAIYGVRGTNGVILITTKKATGAKINRVEYTGYVSTSQISRKLHFLNAEQFRELYPEADNGANTNWLDEITRTPIVHVHNITMQGGNSETNYIANLNYNYQEGIFLKSDNKTLRGRIEVNHKMFDDKLHLRFSLLSRDNQYTSTGAGSSFRPWIYYQAMRYNPTDPIRNADGTWYQNLSKLGYENPLSLINESNGNVKTTEMRYTGTITYNPIKDLTLNGNFSLRRQPSTNGYSETLNHISNVRDGFAGNSFIGGYTDTEKQMELTATYDKTLRKNKFSLLGGYSYISNGGESWSMNNYGFQDDYFGGWHNIGVGNALQQGFAGMSSGKWKTNLISFFTRATYAFDDKYLLMASVRHEGASQLWGTDNAWGTFPAASVGWRISNENFMKDQKIFDDLKLRVGYGVTGSQPSASFLGPAMLKYGDYAYVNGEWIRTIVPASNPNPDLKWEEKRETNIGLDFTSLGGRLSGSIDAYNRDVVGLLYSYNVPMPPNLYPTIMANGGNMVNRGIEVLINATPIQTDDFSWTTTVTYSTNENKLKSLNGSVFKTEYDYFDTGSVGYEGQVTSSHRVQVGQSIGNFYGFKVVDVDNDGKWIYEDRNGQRVPYDDFTHAPEDRHYIGNGIPKWYAGFNNTIRYKSFDFTVNMRGAFNYQVINEARMNFEGTQNGYRDNRLTSVNDKIFGKTTLSPEVQAEFNSYYVEDGDYWKIDNITLGYTVNKLNTKAINSLRFYGSVNNAFIITGYKGIDPEVSTSGLDPGVDRREKFPTIRTFAIGLSAQF
ncbi:SusC/RagA family TonB-linked outer membrane protein [Flavobacterium rhizosphaerae]|uniref:SusC/RagA family TonB-linked outer membrane protein n=1 Tax=Flavobacterium rhizosphaerae TaxID=3163298 RepID=A0ABW8YW40_9FLAO